MEKMHGTHSHSPVEGRPQQEVVPTTPHLGDDSDMGFPAWSHAMHDQ